MTTPISGVSALPYLQIIANRRTHLKKNGKNDVSKQSIRYVIPIILIFLLRYFLKFAHYCKHEDGRKDTEHDEHAPYNR